MRAQPSRAVVGLLSRAVGIEYGARVRTFGVRLHPARAAGFLDVPAATLTNTITALGRLSKTLDERLARVDAFASRSELDGALLEQLRQARPPDALVVRAVDRLLTAGKALTIVDLASELAISPRHLSRRFVEVVGVRPKLVERLARFARAWQQATMGPPLTWAELALANGYADQAHLIREFRAFGAEPPAHLFTDEWYATTKMARR
jgi:AraC-like DNA-binding protein